MSSAAEEEVPYRLYTSEEGAARIGGGISVHTLDRLASSGKVTATYMGRKLLWTDAQLAAAVAYHARPAAGRDSSPRAASRTNRTAVVPAGGVTPLRPKPGRRYGNPPTP